MMQFLKFIIIVAVGWYIGTTVIKLFTNNEDDSSINQSLEKDRGQIEQAINTFNKKLPMQYSKSATMETANIQDKLISFRLTVNEIKLPLDIKKYEFYRDLIDTTFICKHYIAFIDKGYLVKYSYMSDDGNTLFENLVKKEECLLVKNLKPIEHAKYVIAKEMKYLPIEENGLTFENIEQKENTIIFKFKVKNASREDLLKKVPDNFEQFKENFSYNSKIKICKSGVYESLLNKGIFFNPIVLDMNNEVLATTEINKEICKN